MIRKSKDWLVSSIALAATGAGVAGVLSKIAVDVPPADTLISFAGAAVAILAGIYSVYISRVAKTLVRTQRIFLSYSRDQKDVARALRAALVRNGAKVWFDENELQPGDSIKAAISTAIESSNTVVALMSGNIGVHLREELRAATERHVPIFAVLEAGRSVSREVADASERVLFINSPSDVDRVAHDVLASHHGRDTGVGP